MRRATALVPEGAEGAFLGLQRQAAVRIENVVQAQHLLICLGFKRPLLQLLNLEVGPGEGRQNEIGLSTSTSRYFLLANCSLAESFFVLLHERSFSSLHDEPNLATVSI